MEQHTLIDRVYKKGEKKLRPLMIPFRQRMLERTDFSIISNNCWGGIVYEWFGLPKLSPTVGMYFFAEDYLKFISNLRYYLSLEIDIRPCRESKRFERIMKLQNEETPIGVLDNDIEVVMLHYKNPIVAKEKWERRKKRVNFNNLIIKNSYMNDCTDEMVKAFDRLQCKDISPKKIMFVHRKELINEFEIYLPGFEDCDQILNDTYYFNKYFNLYEFLNKGTLISRL